MTTNVKILNKMLAKRIQGYVKRFTRHGRVGSASARTAQHPQISVTNPINGTKDKNCMATCGCRKAADNTRHPFMIKLSAMRCRWDASQRNQSQMAHPMGRGLHQTQKLLYSRRNGKMERQPAEWGKCVWTIYLRVNFQKKKIRKS